MASFGQGGFNNQSLLPPQGPLGFPALQQDVGFSLQGNLAPRVDPGFGFCLVDQWLIPDGTANMNDVSVDQNLQRNHGFGPILMPRAGDVPMNGPRTLWECWCETLVCTSKLRWWVPVANMSEGMARNQSWNAAGDELMGKIEHGERHSFLKGKSSTSPHNLSIVCHGLGFSYLATSNHHIRRHCGTLIDSLGTSKRPCFLPFDQQHPQPAASWKRTRPKPWVKERLMKSPRRQLFHHQKCRSYRRRR